MSINENPYDHMPNFVLRTPLFEFGFYTRLTNNEVVANEDLIKICQDPIVKEAMFLASPTVYFAMEKMIDGTLDDKRLKKLQYTLLKYLTRMSTRCTPFGLFAGCALGEFAPETDVEMIDSSQNKRHTRLDMNFLVALSQDLAKKEKIQENLLFYPNSSLYKSGDKLRYVEYYYVKGTRQHRIVEVDDSYYLQKVLLQANQGTYLPDLISELTVLDVPYDDAKSYISELVENQLLVSELEPSVSGPEFMEQIMKTLRKVGNAQFEAKILGKTKDLLEKIDENIGNSPGVYLDLGKHIEKLSTPFELKYLFQTDMKLEPQTNQISKLVINDVKKGMVLLNKLTMSPSNNNLSIFKQAYIERYDRREMPLSTVLDTETGIGYLQEASSGDINPLVDDLILPLKESKYKPREIEWNRIHDILQMKLLSCDRNGQSKIILEEKDFEEFPTRWDDLPETLSTMAAFVIDKGVQKINFSRFRGSTAAILMGRFCHSDTGIHEHVQNIVHLEERMNPDKVLAEIVHLPEARVGNVLMRPKLREYEIPYLAKSILGIEKQLPLDDLYISIKNDNIFLRSKKLDKQVLPRLTNAHNFSLSTLPIYQFLCDMQTQSLRDDLYFNYGPLEYQRDFLPRVEFGNIIFHLAKWKLRRQDIEELLRQKDNTEVLKELVHAFRKKKRLPELVVLEDNDFKLLVNLNNMTLVQMFLDTVKKRDEFVLSEFLFEREGLVRSPDSYFTNQVIISFFDKRKVKEF